MKQLMINDKDVKMLSCWPRVSSKEMARDLGFAKAPCVYLHNLTASSA
jgi:hypothetical protein